MFSAKTSVPNGQFCLILWTKGYYRPCWMYKHQKNENPKKTYEDKVLKNEASEKDSALLAGFSEASSVNIFSAGTQRLRVSHI